MALGGWIVFLLLGWTSLTSGKPDFLCPATRGLFPDKLQCDLYYKCVGGVSEHALCPDGLVFNPHSVTINPCDHPNNVKCGNRTKLQEPQPSPPYCPRQNGFFPDPDKTICHVFHTCVQGKAIKHTCTSGLWFDASVGTCVWPHSSDRTGCEEERYETKGGFRCPREEVYNSVGQKVAHPKYSYQGDCKKFWICLNGVEPREHGCELGKVFSAEHHTCTYPEEVHGCEFYYEDHPDFKQFSRAAVEGKTRRLNQARDRQRQLVAEGDLIRSRGRGGRIRGRPPELAVKELAPDTVEDESEPALTETELVKDTSIAGEGRNRFRDRVRNTPTAAGNTEELVRQRLRPRARALLFPKRQRGNSPSRPRDDEVKTVIQVVRVESNVPHTPERTQDKEPEPPGRSTAGSKQNSEEGQEADSVASADTSDTGPLAGVQVTSDAERSSARRGDESIQLRPPLAITTPRKTSAEETEETPVVQFQPRSRGGAFRRGRPAGNRREEKVQRTVGESRRGHDSTDREEDEEIASEITRFRPRSRGGSFRGRSNSGSVQPLREQAVRRGDEFASRGEAGSTNIRFRSRNRGGAFGGRSREESQGAKR